MKDLFKYFCFDVEEFNMEVIFCFVVIVLESKCVDRMFKEFCLECFYMVLVVDEFGVMFGLVIIEDILE